jgi:hypothetical protein
MPYIALTTLRAPDTLVAGYQPGDPVADEVVEKWELDDTQVREVEEGTETDLGTLAAVQPALAKPGPEANRAQMEAYAVAIGAMTAEEAADASQEDLEAVEPDSVALADRPADSANKSEWIAYVTRHGGDEAWASDKGTTKADLQAWEPAQAPVPGDTIATALSDQQAANEG